MINSPVKLRDAVLARLGYRRGDELGRRLTQNTFGTLGTSVAATALAFLTSILLGRVLGATGYGTYAYSVAVVELLIFTATLGLGQLLVRNVAAYETRSAWGLIAGLVRSARRLVLLASLVLGTLAFATSWWFVPRGESQGLVTFWIALLTVPFAARLRMDAAALRGFQRAVLSTIPQTLIQPLSLITAFAAAALLIEGGPTPAGTMAIRLAAVFIAWVVASRLLGRHLPAEVRQASPLYETSSWVRSAIPLLFLLGLSVFNARIDVLMLGALVGPREVGIYVVAMHGAELVSFLSGPVVLVLEPMIAALHAKGEFEQMQRVVTRGIRVAMLVAFPTALGLIVLADEFLRLFGPEYPAGRTALTILSAAYLFNASMGFVVVLLVMSGRERDAAIALGTAAALKVSMNAVFIPRWGLEGAAAATATSMVLWNTILVIWVHRKLGIHSTVFGRLRAPWRAA